MENIQLVLKLGEKGESDGQNWNEDVVSKKIMRCGGERGE